MIRKVFFSLVYIPLLITCQDSGILNSMRENINQECLRLRIIAENTQGGYLIEWDDGINTTHPNEKNLLISGPYETHCYILNRSYDTLGYYVGASSPRKYTYFVTKQTGEDTVLIKFQVGLNVFSSYFDSIDQSNLEGMIYRSKFLPKYEVVAVDLKKDNGNWSKINLVKE